MKTESHSNVNELRAAPKRQGSDGVIRNSPHIDYPIPQLRSELGRHVDMALTDAKLLLKSKLQSEYHSFKQK
jgi:hypothetical protein